jgi:hypothetical protein
MTDCYQPKKFALRHLYELKDWLKAININHGGLTLDDLEYKIKQYKPRDLIKEILERRNNV